MSGIVEFLRARYTEAREREASRRSIAGNLPFAWRHVFEWSEEFVEIEGHQRVPAASFYERYGEPAADPTVLADLDAKLGILDLHAPDSFSGHATYVTCKECSQGYEVHEWGPEYPCKTVRHLAVPFAAHEDYDERWRP